MTTESIIEQIKLQPIEGLGKIYEAICDIYRKHLSEMWDIPEEELWWIGERKGGALFLADSPFSLDMEELRIVLENYIPDKRVWEYWEFLEMELRDGTRQYPRIAFRTWFEKGMRPKDLESK